MAKQRLGIVARWRQKRQEHHAHEEDCVALCCGQRGQHLSVFRLTGEPTEAAKLRDLGIREGAQVLVLRDGDPVMIKVDDARLGISRCAAMNVLCEVLDTAPASSSCKRR